MQDNITSASEARRAGNRIVTLGLAGIVAILAVTAVLLFRNLPDANAFNRLHIRSLAGCSCLEKRGLWRLCRCGC